MIEYLFFMLKIYNIVNAVRVKCKLILFILHVKSRNYRLFIKVYQLKQYIWLACKNNTIKSVMLKVNKSLNEPY